MGASICTDNRCILIVGTGADAGRTPTPSTDTTTVPDATTSESSYDAGTVN
jgi:hypothetical protein